MQKFQFLKVCHTVEFWIFKVAFSGNVVVVFLKPCAGKGLCHICLLLFNMWFTTLQKTLKFAKVTSNKINCYLKFYHSHNPADKKMDSTEPVIYRSLNSILEVFKKEEHKNLPGVKHLLSIYNNAHEKSLNSISNVGETKKYPLIVLEGLDGSGKTTVGKQFAKKINAKQWRTPPDSIGHLRSFFDDNKTLRTAYYSLGNYIAGLEVQEELKSSSVVLDRYWHSTAAYAMAQAVADHPELYAMPLKGDQAYSWPEDMLKPDIVLLLDVSETCRLERHSRRNTVTEQENLLKSNAAFRQNVITAYKNMTNPGVNPINADLNFEQVLRQLGEAVQIFID